MLDVIAGARRVSDGIRDSGAATVPFDGRPIQFRDVLAAHRRSEIDLYPEALAQDAPAGLYGYQPDPATS